MRLIFVFSVFCLAACVETAPIVSDYNGDSVKIVTSSLVANQPTEATAAEALRICKAGGKRKAEYASTRTNNQTYEAEHLYLCL